MTDTQLPPSLMAHHAAALRQLARQLVRDPNDAEDALQETWLRALQAPPQTTNRLRAWLETVLRNVVRRRARQSARSHHREHSVARREATDATVDVVAHRQTLRALTDAVLALRPGWQEVVLARYFEGLPPREIARREGREVAAVHRDLERAKAALRQTLAKRLGDRGDWRGPLAALCGLPLPRTITLAPPGLVAGGILIAMKKQLVIALCAACAVALVWVAEPGAPYGETPPSAGEAPLPEPMVASAAATAEAPPARSEVPVAPPVADALAPHRFAMEIHTRDDDDLPVPGAVIWIAPAHHELNRATAGDDGVLRLSWRGRVPSMAMVFGSPDDPTGGKRLRRIAVTAGTTAVAPLRLKRPEHKALFSFISLEVQGQALTRNALSASQLPAVEVDDDGTAWFVTPVQASGSEPATNELTISGGTFELAPIIGRAAFHAYRQAERENREGEAPATGSVRGVVRNARGEPAADVLVQVGLDPDRRSPWSARTANDGTFSIEKIPAGSLHLRAGGGDHGLAHAPIEIIGGQEVIWQGQLDRGVELTGHLVDRNGAALAGWHVEARPHGETGPWIDGTQAGEDGRFAIPNVTHQPYTLRLRPADGVVHGWSVESVWPGGEQELTVRGAELGTGEMRVQPVGPDGQPWPVAELRLWHDEFFEGVRSRPASSDKPRAIAHLAPGLYTVSAGGPGIAFHDAAQTHVAAGSPTELGALALPEPALLGLPEELDPGEAKFALLRLHEAVPSRASALDRTTRKMLLPPGEYLARDGEADREIEVEPGSNVFEPLEPRAK